MLCTIDDIKLRLGLDSKSDAVLTRIAAGFTRRAETHCRRPLLITEDDVTEYYTGRGSLLQLRRYPVVAITSVKECLGGNFDDAAARVEGLHYRLLNPGANNRGVLGSLWGSWAGGYDNIQVVYRGGFCAAGATPDDGEVALPDDLREAAIQQCSVIYKRRDDIGLSGVTFEGGGFQKFQSLQLLPDVLAVLDSYQRAMI